MASISTNKRNGNKRICFRGLDGKRKTLHLGDVSPTRADEIRRHVQRILESKTDDEPIPNKTVDWIRELDATLRDKLARLGLVAKRSKATLQAFLDSYAIDRTDAKDATHKTWQKVRRNLIAYFGAGKRLADITPADAKRFRTWLADQFHSRDKTQSRKLSPTTVSKRCKIARQFFEYAKSDRLISENPFAILKSKNIENRERDYFVTREEVRAVLDVCPDDEWRLLFALSRYAGLRCPSEHLRLRWSDINWERQRMTSRMRKNPHTIAK